MKKLTVCSEITQQEYIELAAPLNCFSKISSFANEEKSIHNNISLNDKSKIYVLSAGEVEIKTKSGVVLYNIKAPFIINLYGSLDNDYDLEIAAISDILSGFVFEIEEWDRFIDKHNLWRDISDILSYYNRLFIFRVHQLSQKNSYGCISETILWHLKYKKKHEHPSLLSFLTKRTNISRSMIAKVLSELRKGKYIETIDGKLEKVNKLPRDF